MNVDYKLPVYLTLLPLVLIFVAVVFNTITTLALLVKADKNVNCFKYLAIIAFFDTLCMFTWNLNQFLAPNFGIEIENYNIYTCRIFLYMQFTAIQISSLLRSLLCIERYYFVMKFSNLMRIGKNLFGSKMSVKFWITFSIILGVILNSHLLFNNGSYVEIRQKIVLRQENGCNLSITVLKFMCKDKKMTNSKHFWKHVNLITALIIPSALMIIFDYLLVYRTYISMKQMQKHLKSTNYHKSNSFTASILYISIAYLVLHTPVNLYFSFSNDDAQYNNKILLFIITELNFLPHSIIFFELYLTNKNFYNIFHTCYDINQDVYTGHFSQVINLNYYSIYNDHVISVIDNLIL